MFIKQTILSIFLRKNEVLQRRMVFFYGAAAASGRGVEARNCSCLHRRSGRLGGECIGTSGGAWFLTGDAGFEAGEGYCESSEGIFATGEVCFQSSNPMFLTGDKLFMLGGVLFIMVEL
jgi:hypothetical protein